MVAGELEHIGMLAEKQHIARKGQHELRLAPVGERQLKLRSLRLLFLQIREAVEKSLRLISKQGERGRSVFNHFPLERILGQYILAKRVFFFVHGHPPFFFHHSLSAGPLSYSTGFQLKDPKPILIEKAEAPASLPSPVGIKA